MPFRRVLVTRNNPYQLRPFAMEPGGKGIRLFIRRDSSYLSNRFEQVYRCCGKLDGCKVYSLICEVKSIVIHLTWRIIYLFFFIVHLLLRTFIHSFYTRRVKRKAFLISLTLFFIDYKTL